MGEGMYDFRREVYFGDPGIGQAIDSSLNVSLHAVYISTFESLIFICVLG